MLHECTYCDPEDEPLIVATADDDAPDEAPLLPGDDSEYRLAPLQLPLHGNPDPVENVDDAMGRSARLSDEEDCLLCKRCA